MPDNFVKVETAGIYTFIATSSNVAGGETVSIPQEYYICKCAVTNAEWKTFIDATGKSAPKYWNGNSVPAGREKHPVLWISCTEAEAYCQWLSGKTEGWTFRLPTSAEWEFAAAGTARTAYPWGDKAGATYSGGTLTSKFNYNAVIAAEVLKDPERLATYNNSKSTRYEEQDKISDIISVSATGGVTGWVDHTNYLGFIYTDIFTEINDAGGNTCAVDAYPEGAT
ncbi:MAG: formylglycine-generating enzyme family protein, partial [Bacteroidales bacterium]|nr:formylglycine-generating enzyme family protein [Bacteroidales bacterium]